ncbi:unnamed protein product [Chilo suppressalis]|uniref:Single domain major allergen protein n=1 Tax=Chilo suppressalis TaxID=168631 RepID=A0ABN8AYZ7_CHISP|nr:hypothetical protein evm_000240 [Chilo suppressalis]CAH0400441.1 unnamed protein product [Chilo suppressalis]
MLSLGDFLYRSAISCVSILSIDTFTIKSYEWADNPALPITGNSGKMKFLVVLFALASVAFSAPQPRKIFHENYEDFMDVISKISGDEIAHIMSHYNEYEEFQTTLTYLSTADFKNLVYEMESLPEFRDVLDFLEGHSIDINYFIDYFNEVLENPDFDGNRRSARHETSGRDFSSFIRDVTAILPKAELAALYDQKMVEDEDFKAAMEGLQSEEWEQVFDVLWASEVFQVEVKTLADNGVEMDLLLDQLVAVFGQN